MNFLPVGRDLDDLGKNFSTSETGQVLPALVHLDAALSQFVLQFCNSMLLGHKKNTAPS